MTKIKLILLLFLTGTFSVLYSQTETKPERGESLDKIVAIVGKEIIMKSDIDGRISLLAQQNPALDPGDEEMRERVLNNLIDEKLIVTKAREDSVVVTNKEIDKRWNAFLESSLQRYGSEERIEEIYGMSLQRMKFQLQSEIKNRILSQKLIQQKFSDLSVSSREVKDFFEEYKDSINQIPPSVEIYHIVREVKAEESASDKAYEIALRVRDSILMGADFAKMAERYSGDQGTASDGGDLGWFERGKLFPEFEKAAFKLQKGDISMPVKTPFGYHLIETLDKKENSVNTRHILFKIGQTQDDKQKTIKFLNNLKDSIQNTDVTFEKMAEKYSEDKGTKGFGGLIGNLPLNEVPADIANKIEDLDEGEISEPMKYGNDPVNPQYHIIYVKDRIEAHPPSIEKDYDYLVQRAKQRKQMRQYEKWMDELRDELYWEIKK